MNASGSSRRSIELDVLRAVAIFLVLGRHMVPCPSQVSGLGHWLTTLWMRGGWVGVDLFFVLSGFLVSGLLFTELQIHGEISFPRFFMRRGLKIYPAFAAYVIFATAIQHFAYGNVGLGRLLAEVVFVQNYYEGLWFHTWSLAVEEHFYLLLPWMLILTLKRGGEDPTRKVLILFAVVATSCLVLRIAGASGPYHFYKHTAPTHKRIDSLFAGVAISVLYHFHRVVFTQFAHRFRIPLIILGIICLALPFFIVLETTVWMRHIGYSILWTGAGAILIALVGTADMRGAFSRFLANIGAHSYSIYLWHSVALDWIISLARRVLPTEQNWLCYFTVYISSALALGILMSKSVEYPVLKLRDRYFPSRSTGFNLKTLSRERVVQTV